MSANQLLPPENQSQQAAEPADQAAEPAASQSAASQPANQTPLVCRPFSQSAQLYDTLYADKDYATEAAIYSLNLGYCPYGSPETSSGDYKNPLPGDGTLIEFGCGTGNFTTRFQALGWKVLGIEPSEDMAALARLKGVLVACGSMQCSRLSLPAECLISTNIRWTAAEMKAMQDQVKELAKPRAAACAPFAVLSYAGITNSELIDCLRNVRSRLVRGGRFVFDVVNAAAANHTLLPTDRRDIEFHGFHVTRKTTKRFDPVTSLLTYGQRFEVFGDDGLHDSWDEVHTLRAFGVGEIALALHFCGFRCLRIVKMNNKPGITVDDWEMMVIAEAE